MRRPPPACDRQANPPDAARLASAQSAKFLTFYERTRPSPTCMEWTKPQNRKTPNGPGLHGPGKKGYKTMKSINRIRIALAALALALLVPASHARAHGEKDGELGERDKDKRESDERPGVPDERTPIEPNAGRW